jgi:hypothetical protein
MPFDPILSPSFFLEPQTFLGSRSSLTIILFEHKFLCKSLEAQSSIYDLWRFFSQNSSCLNIVTFETHAAFPQ